MSDAKAVAWQLRQLAAEVEAMGIAVPKPELTVEQLAGRVASLLEQGYRLEAALLPARLRYGNSKRYRELVAQVREAMQELRELGTELEQS